jgi:glyoxylate/hydroxypyruvate reductase
MSILVAMPGYDPSRWVDALRRGAPERPVATQAARGDPSIRYAVAWKQPEGLLASFPNLSAVFSLGAGVDHILRDPTLPDVPVVRVVADDLTERMSEYVAWRVLDHFRRGMTYRRQQARAIWNERPQPVARDVTVGIMGLGVLGQDAARKLSALGFRIAGWSRTAKEVAGIATFAGDDGLGPFLAETDVLVVLLPATAETRGILSSALFARCKRRTPLGEAPVLVNAGRGSLQREADILRALDEGRLSEASLDVFEEEPLPASSALWRHPRVFVTPHAAAVSEPEALVPPMLRQMDAFERGEPLRHLVDREAGY